MKVILGDVTVNNGILSVNLKFEGINIKQKEGFVQFVNDLNQALQDNKIDMDEALELIFDLRKVFNKK